MIKLLLLLSSSCATAFTSSKTPSSSRPITPVPSSSCLHNAYYIDDPFPLGTHGRLMQQQQQRQQHKLAKSRPPKLHPDTGGQITLVGSGPGSPSLLTLAAHSLITNPANLIIVDRLVSSEILNVMKESGVEYKIANKHPGCQDTAQNEIFEWCKEGLLAGRHVVRLKIGELLFLHVSSYSFVFGVAVVHILDANLTLCSSSSQIPYDEINTHTHTLKLLIKTNNQKHQEIHSSLEEEEKRSSNFVTLE